jgi:predicted extracellular nuclease
MTTFSGTTPPPGGVVLCGGPMSRVCRGLVLASLLAGCAGPVVRHDGATVLVAAPADWTPLAGQRVRIAAPLTVTDTYPLAERGQLLVAFDGRALQPTEVAAPGAPAAVVAAANARRRLVLDDGLEAMPADPANPLPALPGAPHLRSGSVLTGVEGTVVVDAHGPRLVLAKAEAAPAPRPAPPQVAGALRLGSFNVLNLFNGDGAGGGFPTPRGAKTAAEYARQQAKLVASVQALAPDAAALMEVENDGYGPASALADFVEALDAAGPARDYAFVDAKQGPGTDAIRVALIYRTSKLRPVGAAAALSGGPFDTRTRPPLAQAFVPVAHPDAPPLVLVAVHLKSKGCGRDADAATGADADQRDGQSCWNAMRVDAARRIDAWLRGDPTRSQADRIVLLGDFNAYSQEDPLRLLREAGWVDPFADDAAPDYSFVFGGASGRLDHVLLSPAAAPALRGAAHWHNNADEPAAARAEAGTDASAYGASDHDPLVIGGDWAD